MSGYAIELNDADIVAWDVARELLADTGYAHVDPPQWIFGAAAAATARLTPRATVTAQYASLDANGPGPPAASAADIVYRQFKTWAGTLGSLPGIWLTSPAATPAQLGLLLGIAQAADLNVATLADRAVAAVSALPFEGTVFCVDVELERGLLTEVHLHSGRALRHRVLTIAELGQRPLYEAWSKGFASRMVQTCRFDPLHVASTEQILFDALPRWLDTLARADRVEDASIEAGGVRYSIEYRALHAMQDVLPNYRALVRAMHGLRRAQEPAAILLTAGAARLPGLLEALNEFQDCDVFTAKRGQAAQAALGAIDPGAAATPATSLMLSLPHNPYHSWLPERAAAAAMAANDAATHLVFGGRAMGLSGEPLLVGAAPEGARILTIPGAVRGVSRLHCSLMLQGGHAFVVDHSRFGSYLNDERVAGRAILKVGDRLRLGNPGVELAFVRLD